MLSLGKLYYQDIPPLADLGFFGALILGSILILVFMGVGWLYDEKAKLWKAKQQVNIDRFPYRCVPNIRAFSMDYPILFAFLTSLFRIFDKLGLDTEPLNDLSEYLTKNYSFRAEKSDMDESKDLGDQFMENRPFRTGGDPPGGPVSLTARVALGFETQSLRFVWIQELTGMAQDALVITGVYVIFLFPNVVVDGVVPLSYMLLGILIVAFPVMFLIVGLGWFYDRKLKIWSVDRIVRVERTPYSYLAEPNIYTIFMPYYMTLFRILGDVQKKEGLDTTEVDKILTFLDAYFKFDVAKTKDMERARQLRRDYGTLFATKEAK